MKRFLQIITACIFLLLLHYTIPIPTSTAATILTTTDWIFPNTVHSAPDYANPLNILERDGNIAVATSSAGLIRVINFDSVYLPVDAEITKIEMRFHLAGIRTTYRFQHNFEDCLDHERQLSFYKDFIPASTTIINDYIGNYTNLDCTISEDYIRSGNYAVEITSYSGLGNYKVDDISVRFTYTLSTTPTPTPTPTPIPFLDLPWDYEAKGLSFNEGALAINSYFDHEYPLLSSGLSEPASASGTIVNYLGFPRVDKPYSMHDGYDYGTPAKVNLGDAVLAAASGSAKYVNTCGACGNMIVIDHENGYQTRYLHLQKDGLVISTTSGSINVAARDKIGKVGSTGNSTGAHIHFGVFQDKNKDGYFIDNVPDGVTDPFGWQSKDPDPWEAYSFFYNGLERMGNRSYYLWIHPLVNLTQNISSNGGTLTSERYTVSIPQGATTQNLTLAMQASPIVKSNDPLVSIGSAMSITAKDTLGNSALFIEPLSITIDFSQYDLSRFKSNAISIYSSADNINWVNEKSLTDTEYRDKKATLQTSHLTYFALMAERADTIAPTTTAILAGQQGEPNLFRSDVEVSLNAQDNANGLGVNYTVYKIEGGDWEQYVSPLLLTNEGHHRIEFYSVDKDENIETMQSQEFDIDKTPPEANIHFDTKIQDLVLIGSDNASQTSIVQTQISKTTKQSIITDKAGNTLIALIDTSRVRGSTVFSISSLVYNPVVGTPVDSNKLSIRYQTSKSGAVRSFDQTFEVKGVVQIQLSYDPKTDKTTVTTGAQKITVSGMQILQISTANGALRYSY